MSNLLLFLPVFNKLNPWSGTDRGWGKALLQHIAGCAPNPKPCIASIGATESGRESLIGCTAFMSATGTVDAWLVRLLQSDSAATVRVTLQ